MDDLKCYFKNKRRFFKVYKREKRSCFSYVFDFLKNVYAFVLRQAQYKLLRHKFLESVLRLNFYSFYSMINRLEKVPSWVRI